MSVEIVPWSSGTDEQIAAMLDAAAAGEIDLQQDGGWAVGDRRVITLTGLTASGETQQNAIVITSFDEYMGCGNLLQFDFEDSPTGNSMFDGSLGYRYSKVYRNESGYLVDSMPVLFRHRLKTFDVLCDVGNGQVENIITIPGNQLANRSRKEVFGDGPDEGTYISYYSSVSHRTKELNGYYAQKNNRQPEPKGWWLRTSNGSGQYYCVSADGNLNSADAQSTSLGLSLFGCLGGYNGTILKNPIAINSYNFPDETFRQSISIFDLDNDGYLNQYEMEKCIGLDSQSNRFSSAKSLIGIELLTCLETVFIDLTSGEFIDEDVDLSALTLLKSCYISIYGARNILLHGSKIRSLRLYDCNKFKNIEYVEDPVNMTSLQISFSYPTETIHKVDITHCQNLKILILSGFICNAIDIRNNPRLLLAHEAPQDVPSLTWDYGTRVSGSAIKGSVRAVKTEVVYNAGQNPLQQQFPEDNLTMATYRLVYDLQSTVITNVFSITEDAEDVSVREGANAIFNCQAISNNDIQYSWEYRNYFTNMASANIKDWTHIGNGQDLTVKASALLEYHVFRCYIYSPSSRRVYLVEDQDGGNRRNEYFYHSYGYTKIAHLKVNYPIAIIEQPENSANIIGDISDFTVKASNDPPMVVDDDQTLYHPDRTQADIKYLWQSSSDGEIYVDIQDAVSKTLSVVVNENSNDTQYRCKVYNDFGEVYTEPARLSVILPPTIIQHPQRLVIKNNTSVTFSVEATINEVNNSYQWQVSTDGGNTWYEDTINGITSGGSTSEYYIIAMKSMDHYQYRCAATNIAGTVISNPAELRVLIEPSITAQPEDTTVETTKTARFSITAAGDELSYQWQVSTDNGTNWNDTDPVGNSPEYSFNVTKALTGNKYRCVVTNEVGSATSDAVSLKVMDAPTILDNPVAITVRDSNNASFSVTATGDELSYQWQVSTDNGTNWEDVAGETSDTYSFTALFAMNGNMYRCKVYNDVKTVYTEPALLTVTIQPSITTQPQDARIASGSNAVFSVEATDREGAGLAYTWQAKESENGEWIAVSGDAYSGNSTASLTVTASADIDGYRYRCFIEGGHDSIMSESAAIDVVTPPVITGELQNITIRSGSPVSFTASAEGKYTSYQWQTYLHERWTNIDGAANDTYTLIQENPAETGIGTAMYRYTVTNIAGTVTSSAATVTVIPSIVITSQPLSAESPAGGVVRFTVGAAGERLRYRWQTRGRSSSAWSNVSGELYEGETTQTLSVSVEIVLSGNQYRCIITDEYSDNYPLLAQSVTSDAATLTTSSLQVILTQPIDTTVAAGDLASFEVIADDEGYAYQWQVSTDGGDTWSNIQNNGNSPVYVFTANADQSGAKFCCVVTSDRWAVISSAATLTVATEPVIESEPQDARVGEDKSAEFHIGASGVELQYQWQISTDGINWTDIPDDRARTDTISVTAAMQANGSRYRCKVYNIAGTVYSRDAVLSVIEKIRILANPEDQVAANGDTVSFSVSVSGYSPGYQWQEKAADSDAWINVQDASAAGITLNVTANEQSNGKRYRCIIMNDAGEETSASALLTVYFKPVFTVQPHGGDVDESSVVSLHAEANGGGVSYQWQSKRENGTYWSDLTIDGATSDTLPLTAHVAINGIQYRCVATNLAGTTESEPATFHVDVTSFCLADGSEIDEGVLPAGYYTFNLNADRKGVVYDIGLFDGANTDWIVVEASSARTFYTNGRKAIKILFHHTDNADLEYYAIRPMLEEGQEAHQWASPANAAYEHDAANDFNYGWFSIGNKYGDRENIVTASAPCVMTLRYRPIWKDTL